MAIIEYNALDGRYEVNYRELGSKVYKLLPIFEGRVKDSNTKIESTVAMSNFKKNLDVLCLEIAGILSKIEVANCLLEIQIILEGLRTSPDLNHETVKCAILHSMNLLKDIA